MKPISKLFMVILVVAVLVIPGRAATYYVDSASGSDSYSGTSPTAPWQTLTKLTTGRTFVAGDRIYLKAGSNWTGQFHPLGSGADGNPIIIDMYGTGNKPSINGNGVTGNGTIYLYNQSYWEISNLEITNDATDYVLNRRGLYLSASNYGVVNHIHVKNCYIHHVSGSRSTNNGDTDAKRTGGIIIETISDTTTPTRFNDILIEGCEISNVARHAIVGAANKSDQSLDPTGTTWNNKKATKLVIRNNVIHDIAVNAMIIRLADSTCTIENNVIYNTSIYSTGNTIFTAACNGTVFQYNEGYLNLTPDFDGCLYDSDMRSQNIMFQYSYSHDNNHGLFWTYPTTGAGNPGIVVRYNISRNDKGIIFAFSGSGGTTNTEFIYNNTIYTNTSQNIFEQRGGSHTVKVWNNVFCCLNSSTKNSAPSSTTYDYNLFYPLQDGFSPSDAHKLTADPKLANPMLTGPGGDISVTTGWASLDDFKLQPGSPCIDSGMGISGNIKDLWGNSVPYNRATDRGAYEYSPAADTTPPSPTPMTFSTSPYGASSVSVSMAATPATDTSGVEYLFTCTGGSGGHSSGWQDGANYTDTGLAPSTTYTYTVKARDKSPAANETAASSPASATTQGDTSSPVPSPMTFDTAPYAVSVTAIAMLATTASDISGVEYMFTCTSGGGHSSAWQDGTSYTDTGLSPSTTYTYTVKARDKSSNHTETLPSPPASATTMADTVAPMPNPMAWAAAPAATGVDTITMTAAVATDISGVEYFFANITDPNHNSGWQNSETFVDTSLLNNTQYRYAVTARDKSLANNETDWSVEAAATTPKYVCTEAKASDLNGDCQVDLLDFAILANAWAGELPAVDLNADTALNWLDILKFSEEWISCNRNPAGECWQ